MSDYIVDMTKQNAYNAAILDVLEVINDNRDVPAGDLWNRIMSLYKDKPTIEKQVEVEEMEKISV